MNAYWSRPLNYPWPPFIFALAIIAALLMPNVRVLSLPVDHQGWQLAAGIALIVGAITMDLWALLTLRRGRTTILPNRRASHLVTGGPFRFSRNPIYLGYTLLTIGIGLVTGNGWYLAAAFLAAIITYLVAIRAEEMHLLARFGIDFEHYRKSTRCWI